MSYIKAETILPQDLIEVIQQYVSGKNIYIPCKEKQDWGSQTHSKQYYAARNRNIYKEYKNGFTVTDLSKKYSLSEKSVYRVLKSQNR
ncbi:MULTISPECIES: CD3324 family protein [Butyrivibrio]|jgi:Mor family transcriptional regulator|uniref:Mor transcription activator family protein n=1 Tax=Butyrivibrio fibrisolvens DSM 3071 TaxID=1121131 RepID=A0A1M5ZST2_BUTFI|nr:MULTISPECIES: CD3324 family protein [Butyrivibrio]SHI27261.1 Mor transcription activator family protein [Butyrivibrio fibrisolvens DSM 3071]